MEVQDLALYEGSGDQGGQINSIGSYSADPTGHFGHLVAKVFNVFSGFFREPHFLQGLEKRVNSGRVDMFLLLDHGAEDLRTRGIIPEVFFNSFPDLKCYGCEHSLSTPSNIVAVKVEYRETI